MALLFEQFGTMSAHNGVDIEGAGAAETSVHNHVIASEYKTRFVIFAIRVGSDVKWPKASR